MAVTIKPSDLFYRYPKNHEYKTTARFSGPPDPEPFDKDDLYEVIPLLEKVMDALGTDDGRILRELEEVMVRWMPADLRREQAFHMLVDALKDYTV